VKFELAGFEQQTYPTILLTLNNPAVLRVKLGVATIKQAVTISGDASPLNTTNSEGGEGFDGRRVANLPLSGGGNLGGNTRDVYGVANSNSGAVGTSGGIFTGVLGTKISDNGHGFRANSTSVDGQIINDPASAGRQLPMNNPDAVQEVRTITNQFAAENGGAAGAIVSVSTRSGSKDLHGSLFWFNNINRLNSLNNLDKAVGLKSAPHRVENQFGGTIGGPIAGKKTFYFGSLQRWTDRNLSSGLTIGSAPTEDGRALLQANGGTRVTTKALLENLPAAQSGQRSVVRYCFNPTPWTQSEKPPAVASDPNNPGQFICGSPAVSGWSVAAVPVGALSSSNLIRYDDWQGSIRIDQKLNNSHLLSGRYIFNDDLQTGAGQITPTGLTNITPTRSQAATIGMTSTLPHSLFNEFRVSWSRYAFNTGPENPDALNVPSIEIADLGLTGFASVGPRTALGYPANLPEGRKNNIYQLLDNMTWTHGSHTTKLGVDIRKQEMASDSTTSVRGQLRYSSLTNFVADFADTRAAISAQLPGGQSRMYFDWTDWFFFAQDDWRVTRNFTLNLGFRYELPGNSIESLYPVSERIAAANGNDPIFRYNSRPPRDTNNLMPRLGFNWYLGSRGTGLLNNTVLRGGYARTNDYVFLIMAVQVSSGFPFVAGFNLVGTPGTMETLPAVANQTLTSADAKKLSQTLFMPDFHTPYADQYSLELQRGMGANNVFRLGYVGTKGTGLFQSQEGNPVSRCGVPNCTNRLDPDRGVVRARANTGSSIYHSMQVSLDHRSSRGLSGGVHYTWSSYIDNGSDIVNPSNSEVGTPQDPFNRNAGERARSTYDRPHRLTSNLVYQLPFLNDRKNLIGKIGSGWQVGTILTLQSGTPFTVLNGTDPGNVLLGSLVGNAIRPNFAPGVDVEKLRNMTVPEIRRNVLEAGSTSIFFRAETTTGGPTAAAPIGNVPRNFLRSDGLVSIDFNIVKNIRINEGHALQFRADIFNLPNTRNFGVPTALANAANVFDFLNEGATDGGNRRIFLSLRYSF